MARYPTNTSSPTKAQRVFLDLRSRILSGELPATTRLTLRPLARKYGTGMNAVSEAVKELAAEGLVVLEGQAGALVLTRDLQRIRGEYALRVAIECETSRRCTFVADEVQMSILGRMAAEMDQLFEAGEQLERCRQLDVDFHLMITDFSGISQFRNVLHPLLDRLVMLDQTPTVNVEFPGQKHLELYEALKTRDPEIAASRMRQHCEVSMNLSLAALYD